MPREQRPTNPYPLVHAPRPSEFPLSVGQERMWRQDQLHPSHNHVTGGWRMAEALDREALSVAVANLIRRHEVLRTRFVSRPDGAPVQQVVENLDVPIVWAGDTWREALDRSVVEQFDLSSPPLCRLVVANLDTSESGLFATMHHIVMDRWSMDIFARDLFELYAAALAERDPQLPDVALQYGDYALWQRRFLDSALIQPRLDRWKLALEGSTRLELPTDRPPSTADDAAGQEVAVELSAEFTQAMATMAWRTRGSPAMVVTAALSAVLSEWTGQTDIVIGAILSDRPRPELQDLIGLLINTVILRIDLSLKTLTFRELVKRTREAWMVAHANQDVPFEQITTALQCRSETPHPSIFNVVVNHGGGWPSVDQHPGIPPEWNPPIPGTAIFELSLSALMIHTLMVNGRLRVAFVYKPSLFDHSTVEALSARYLEMLERGVTDCDQPLAL